MVYSIKNVLNRLDGQVVWSYVVTAIISLISPVLIAILTRELGVAQFGIYSLLAVSINVSSVVLDLGIAHYVMTHLSGCSENERTQVFCSLLAFYALFLIAVGVIILATPLKVVIASWLGLETVRPIEIAVGVVVLSVFSRICTGLLASKKEIGKSRFIFLLSQSLMGIIIICYFLTGHPLNSVLLVMDAWIVGAGITLATAVVFIRKNIGKASLNLRIVLNALAFGTPLILGVAGSWIMEIGDRYVLNSFLGAGTVGLYSVGYGLMMLVGSLGTLILETKFPFVADAWNLKKNWKREAYAALRMSYWVVVPVSVFFCWQAENLVFLAGGSQFVAAAGVIRSLAVYPFIAVVNLVFYQLVLLKRTTREITIAYVTGGVLNIATNILLIPYFGMIGSGIATVFSYAIVALLLQRGLREIISWTTVLQVRHVGLLLISALGAVVMMKILFAIPWMIGFSEERTLIISFRNLFFLALRAGMYGMFGLMNYWLLNKLLNITCLIPSNSEDL